MSSLVIILSDSPSHGTENIPDNSNFLLENIPELSEEQRLWLRQRGSGGEGEQHSQAGDQEQGGLHDEQMY